MYVVTGGAGFIGANIVKGLNERGIDDILVVDNLTNADKFLNLTDCEIADYMDKRDFLAKVQQNDLPAFTAVFHEGACSDTMEHDGHYMMQNNYEYSKALLHHCLDTGAQYIYASSASVYGGGRIFSEQRQFEAPLNVYGYSKFLFDQYVRRLLPGANSQIAGFRYFNVYGPREQHKGRMASVALHFYHQYQNEGRVKLFSGCDGYGDGEQKRDFISVEDVARVNFYFLDHPDVSGIFNVGTGRSQSFNDVAVAAVNAVRASRSEDEMSLEQMQSGGLIEYIEFPESLRGKYQSFTEADISSLRQAGYAEDFLTVEQGVNRYIGSLLEQNERREIEAVDA